MEEPKISKEEVLRTIVEIAINNQITLGEFEKVYLQELSKKQ
jgi:hypothetical protein